MADNSITFSTALDNKQLEKDLAKTKREIEKLELSTADQEKKKSPLVQQAQELEQRMRAAREEAQKYQADWAAGAAGADKSQSDAIMRVQQLEAAHAKVVAQIDKADAKLSPAYEKLDAMKEKAGGIERELVKASGGANRMGQAVDAAGKHMDKFANRVKALARRVLVFSVITMGLRQMRTWLGKVIKTNDEATGAVARLKGALLTLAQPLVNVVIPAFTVLVNVLTRVISAIAQLMSSLFGGTINQSKEAAEELYKETEALEDTGKAAEDAERSMASFDEINQLPSTKKGEETQKEDDVAPDFGFDADMGTTQLDGMLTVIEAIGAALLAWKISDSFLGGIKTAAGLFLALKGGIELAKQMSDAWINGVSWDNFFGMLASGAVMTAGLALAFGKMGAGIGLIVTGIALLVTAFRDAMANGWNLQNSLMAVAGIMATGLGIAFLTGSMIPALIAGVAALLLAITIATGHGEELIAGVKQILQGFIDFFVGIFTGDIARAIEGVNGIFGGLKTVVSAVLSGVRDLILSFFDWLNEKTGGRFSGIIEFVKGIINGFFGWAMETFGALADGIAEILSGIITFLTGAFTGDWDMAWQGVKDIFAGIWNTIVGVLGAAVNTIISGINWVIEKLNSISVDVPEWVPGLGGKKLGFSIPSIQEWEIPYLAQGAVIPPNREFMAVLGDQRSGTNIEAPLDTIKQGLREVMAEAGGGQAGPLEVRLILSAKPGMAREMKFELDRESKRQGVKLVQGV